MSEPNNNRFTILIIEDDESLRDIYEEWLRADNRKILKFASAEEALESVAAESPDLILLDIGLPGISGIDFLRVAFKGRSSVNVPPVIIISGMTELSSIPAEFILSVREHFTKPVAQGRLTECVGFIQLLHGAAVWDDPDLQ